jgi:hypothetical protein
MTKGLAMATVFFVLACGLAVIALALSVTGPTGALVADGPGMACVQLSDEGKFPGIPLGEAPTAFDVSMTGRLTCEWSTGTLSYFNFVQLNDVSRPTLVGALVLAAASVVAAASSKRRKS